jgi:hypothetical protein
MDLGHWQTKLILEKNELPYGFVYQITNLTNNRKYIGKKQCFSIKKLKPLKGKKNKRHKLTETDWKSYTSSSNELNADISKLGKENFKFEILKWCSSKSEMNYFEAKIQFDNDVLLSDNYYNGIINVRIANIKNSTQCTNH